MVNLKRTPIEISGYKNVLIPSYDTRKHLVEERWISVQNDTHSDDDYEPWNDEAGSEVCPF